MFQEGAEEATGDEYYQIIGQGAQVINPNSFFFQVQPPCNADFTNSAAAW